MDSPGESFTGKVLQQRHAELRVDTRVEIAKLHESLGNTMIYVTHDQTEAMTLADKIVVLRKGRVEQAGPPMRLYEDPDNLFVAGFIGSPKMNFFAGTIETDGQVRFAGLTVPLPGGVRSVAPGSKVTIGIRPEHLGRDAAAHELGVAVDFVEHLGGPSFVHGHTGSGEKIIVERREAGAIRSGDQIAVRFSPADLRAFDGEGLRLR